MTKYFYDLHIHSKLSSCSDELMSPNNILNWAKLNNLDLIAICDHNSTLQLKVINEIAKSYDFITILGCEVAINNGLHVLCYFMTIQMINEFQNYLNSLLDLTKLTTNRQIIYDIFDEEVDLIKYDLHQNLNITIDELIKKVHSLNGLCILAHIERNNEQGLRYLLENDTSLDGIEINRVNKNRYINLKKYYPKLSKYAVFYNSDAHCLFDILAQDEFIELDELNLTQFFDKVRKGGSDE